MGVFRNLAIGILAISLLTFVALFGRLPALRKTPIGWLQRVLCLHLPSGLKSIDNAVTGGRLTRESQSLGTYLFHERNPVVLYLFLSLLSGSATLFLWNTIHILPLRYLLPLLVLLPAPYVFTYLCVSHTAHYIDAENHAARLADYPFDFILYRPGKVCSTCRRVKPARSKHCSLCGHCVAKCDHHCPWVNNCLGRGNYRYFLALLISIDVLQLYGAYLSWRILRPHFTINPENAFFSRGFLNDVGRASMIAINMGGISVAGVGLLAASTASLPFGLFVYHCYLIWAGTTTNETSKWADWREDMHDGLVFGADRQVLQAHIQQTNLAQAETRNPALQSFMNENKTAVLWPVHSNVILVRTRDGNPPQAQESLWTRVKNLQDVTNIYDLGAWSNLTLDLQGL